MFSGILTESILKRAIDNKVVEIEIIDMRTYSLDKHHHVDDTPCGGGAGMVLACDVVDRAILANSNPSTHKILMTPQGKPYNQQMAIDLSKMDEILIICGHYEGFDERIRSYVDEEISIGDYVLTGGEIASMALIDSITRLLDDAITKESYMDDSFMNGLLEYPQYTRPVEYKGMKVPDVLLSGNHEKIRLYRKKESLKRTMLQRKDLFDKYEKTKEDLKLIKEIEEELK
jgi:tRNA (guanine37-N1)-methyltransferase